MTNNLDLPDGFDDAPTEMQIQMLQSKLGPELANAIRERAGVEQRDAAQLSKNDMVQIYQTLRELQATTADP